MAKTIPKLVQQVEVLYTEMKDFTLAAGVTEAQYESVRQADDQLTKEVLQDRIDFLKSVKEKEYHDFHKVYSLLKPETWAMYKLLGQHQLNEQVEFKKTSKALRKVWRAKYGSV